MYTLKKHKYILFLVEGFVERIWNSRIVCKMQYRILQKFRRGVKNGRNL
jgi:hypothetical protein